MTQNKLSLAEEIINELSAEKAAIIKQAKTLKGDAGMMRATWAAKSFDACADRLLPLVTGLAQQNEKMQLMMNELRSFIGEKQFNQLLAKQEQPNE